MFRNKIFNQKGFAVFFVAVIVLSALLIIAFSLTFLTLSANKVLINAVKSTQSYYTAEAGVEDALLRIFSQMPYSESYSLSLAGAQTNIAIEQISGSLTVTSQGDFEGRIRNIEVRAVISTDEASFFYGVQVGEGGLIMAGNSQILGNVYSNGPITGASNTKIYGDAYSAGPTGSISDSGVLKSGTEDGNAYANTISGCNIQNGAYYQNISSTTAGAYYPGSPDPEPEDMPINQYQIDKWKNDAAEGGTISGYYLEGNSSDSLGPIKVQGDFRIDNNAIFTQTGTIWVTGDIILSSNAIIQLDPGYESDSGIIIADGRIALSSNVVLCGSEGYKSGGKCYTNEGSFLMLLSTNSSLDPSSPAISAVSNSQAAILYANNGLIRLDSNSRLKEVTGYALYFASNSVVTYETGLADLKFSSGPSGGWKISSWKEVE